MNVKQGGSIYRAIFDSFHGIIFERHEWRAGVPDKADKARHFAAA